MVVLWLANHICGWRTTFVVGQPQKLFMATMGAFAAAIAQNTDGSFGEKKCPKNQPPPPRLVLQSQQHHPVAPPLPTLPASVAVLCRSSRTTTYLPATQAEGAMQQKASSSLLLFSKYYASNRGKFHSPPESIHYTICTTSFLSMPRFLIKYVLH